MCYITCPLVFFIKFFNFAKITNINHLRFMKKTKLLFICLFSCLFLTMKAQNVVVLKDSTMLVGVKLKDTSPIQKQYEIEFTDKKNKEYHLKPEDVIIFNEKKKRYLSKTFNIDGISRQLFLERIMYNDSVSLYIYRSENNKDLVLYEKNREVLIPLIGTNNAFTNYLKNFPVILQNPELAEEIETVPPTPSHLIEKYNKVKKNNINLFTRFRWGIMVGGGFSQIKKVSGNLLFSNESHLTIGLFADLPVYKHFSFHPEVFYLKNAKLNEQTSPVIGMSYNREYISMPLLARFSFINLKSKAIPYLQVGPEIMYLFKGETNGYEMREATGYETQITEWDTYLHDNFAFTFSAGVGVEYKLNKRHSLFFDVRYRIEPSVKLVKDRKTSINSVFTTISFNL